MRAARRPWLQIHLSTALALMFIAASLLWINFKPSRYYVAGEGENGTHDVYCGIARGWPLTCHWPPVVMWGTGKIDDRGAVIASSVIKTTTARDALDGEPATWDVHYAALNAALAAAILIASAMLLEVWTCRRSSRIAEPR